MPVVAMTMELGVRGDEVAAGAAKALGIRILSNDLAERVAGRAKVKKSLVQRLREGKASLLERLWAPGEEIALFTAEEVFAAARVVGIRVEDRARLIFIEHAVAGDVLDAGIAPAVVVVSAARGQFLGAEGHAEVVVEVGTEG